MSAEIKALPKKIKKGWALLRVSTTEQALVQHGSLEQQRHMVERWAKNQSEITGILFQIDRFIEEDISGRATSLHKRFGLQDLKRAIERKEIDFFVAEKVDRVSRDQIFNLQLVKNAQTHDVEVYEFESGLIDLRNRGSRLGFNIKNMLAEEYSLELEEKISKKMREARVNNGKDTSTIPILGLDKHPKKIGMYLKNEEELEIVRDIYAKFIEQKSFRAVLNYCQKKGYKTKVRFTKEKIDGEGNIIPPRKVGGEDFNHPILKHLLTTPKYRGYSRFKDTWNQFPKLQDSAGFVTWEYLHGRLIDKEITDKVDKLIEEFEKRRLKEGKHHRFLLSGILFAPDGTSYGGASARSGTHVYYQNEKLKKRFPCDEVEDLVLKRVRQYLADTGLWEEIIKTALKHQKTGLPFLEEQIRGKEMHLRELEKVTQGFSESLRRAASQGRTDLTDVAQSLLAEKDRAEIEIGSLREELELLHKTKERMLARFNSSNLQKYLSAHLHAFDGMPVASQKELVRRVIAKAIVRDDNRLELHINVDPRNSRSGNKTRLPGDQSSKSHLIEMTPMRDGNGEVKSSSYVQNGGR